MTVPKLYLVTVRDNAVEKVQTYRELAFIQKDWLAKLNEESIYLLHCGFLRPEFSGNFKLSESFKGRMLYSASSKWSLPKTFNSSRETVASINVNAVEMPLYLALDQWGYEVKENDVESISTVNSEVFTGDTKKTIVEAAEAVLKEGKKKLLNKEEIYALIIENGYYHFGEQKPVTVLNVQLNRYTQGTEYSRSAEPPMFGKTNDGRFYLIGDGEITPSGWVSSIAEEEPELFQHIQEYGVCDESSYLAIRESLPELLCAEVDQKRFEQLRTTINQTDPSQLLAIAPCWLLRRHISDLGLTVRASNVFLSEGLALVSDIARLSLVEIMCFSNMGRRSIKDICNTIILKIEQNVFENLNLKTVNESLTGGIERSVTATELGAVSLAVQIEKSPLIKHLTRTLNELAEKDRLVLCGRLGYKGKVLTLEQVGQKLDVTRERVRQIQKKYVTKIIAKEYWDDVIGIRIGQLLLERDGPLILEMLEIEDDWFSGFGDNYIYLSSVIQLFSENEIRVIDADGRNVITRMTQNDWDLLKVDVRKKLKQKANEKQWVREDINQYMETCLFEYSAQELTPILHELFDGDLQYEGESSKALLVSFGKTAESAVAAVLAQAEKPLHYSEIAIRASDLLGKKVEQRRAHGAVSASGVWMFNRGTYGLIDHCPIPESRRMNIRSMVEQILYQSPINKQWHSKEIIECIAKLFPILAKEINPYTLRMCIEGSDKILFLKRMVWARSDSGMEVGDRIETVDSFIQILEGEGKPLSGQDLKVRLSEIRGVADDMQIHGNERLVAVGPNIWGLSEWS
ncbi:MAG: hypothetical protein COB22_02215 [Cycloclasticus sp.]|nr:MAG: hypothetical protein COB22_02215 [Cycloclasticus sp.]